MKKGIAFELIRLIQPGRGTEKEERERGRWWGKRGGEGEGESCQEVIACDIFLTVQKNEEMRQNHFFVRHAIRRGNQF